MKKHLLILSLLLSPFSVVLHGQAVSTKAEIGDTVQAKQETIEVKQVSRIWRIQADANGDLVIFFELVAIFPDGQEVRLATTSTSRSILTAADLLEPIEKAARAWLAEDQQAAAEAALQGK